MRPLWKDILAAVWLGIVIPGIVLNAAVLFSGTGQAEVIPVETVQPSQDTILLRTEDGTEMTVDTQAYLTGVLLAEMPVSFAAEALKAQSVAARTYVRKAEHTGGKHGDGSVCSDSSCCQAYVSPEAYLNRGGSPEVLEKVRQAVEDTQPYVLTYDGQLIEAVYFSCSGGTTEAAVAVWGAEFPYLQSVESPGEEAARYHTDSLLIPEEDFFRLLDMPVPENRETWFGEVSYTEGGGVAAMKIGDRTFTGVQLRSLLDLRSTAFTMEPAGAYIRIATRGYGHRVGMSQYGANAMAEAGSTWQQILQHYYPGTTIVPIS